MSGSENTNKMSLGKQETSRRQLGWRDEGKTYAPRKTLLQGKHQRLKEEDEKAKQRGQYRYSTGQESLLE